MSYFWKGLSLLAWLLGLLAKPFVWLWKWYISLPTAGLILVPVAVVVVFALLMQVGVIRCFFKKVGWLVYWTFWVIWWIIRQVWAFIKAFIRAFTSIGLLIVVWLVSAVVIVIAGGLWWILTTQFSWWWPVYGASVVTLVAAHVGPFLLVHHREGRFYLAQLATLYVVGGACLGLAYRFDVNPLRFPQNFVILGIVTAAFIVVPAFLNPSD